MKLISASEPSKAARGELQQRYEHRQLQPENGLHIGALRNRDGSTDFIVKDHSGSTIWTQNSGVGLGCHMVASGVGTTVGILSRNTYTGVAAATAVRQGCNAMGHSSRSQN